MRIEPLLPEHTEAPKWAAFDEAKLPCHRFLAVKDGFRIIGTRGRIGRHHGAWRDVVLLERRSPLTD
ncbi:hypothetical protein GCM10010425_83190 [Streptomyces spororaveus]|uniref:Uncharacterized protein n=1 Tax=Streptomyces spororaveus TaxID=284039 RepID=A0ABQ3T5R9_9ACTN|nr:hypothetical protein Sspor_12750 [Streptomyces spororaveus]